MLKKLTYLFLIIAFFSCEKKQDDTLEKKAQEYIISAHKEDIRILYEYLQNMKSSNPSVPIGGITYLYKNIYEQVDLIISDSMSKIQNLEIVYKNKYDSLLQQNSRIKLIQNGEFENETRTSNSVIGKIKTNNVLHAQYLLINFKEFLRDVIEAYAYSHCGFNLNKSYFIYVKEDSLKTIIKFKYDIGHWELFMPVNLKLYNVNSEDTLLIKNQIIKGEYATIEADKLLKGNYMILINHKILLERGVELQNHTILLPFEIF